MRKSHLALVAPSTVNGTVAKQPPPRRRKNAEVRVREYLTDAEIAKLITAAGFNRHAHRDATMVLLAYRHGLRVAELVALRWDSVDFGHGRLHVNRAKAALRLCTHFRAANCGPCAGSSASKSLKSFHFHLGAGCAIYHCGLPQVGGSPRRRGQARVPGPSAHAAARLRVSPGQPGRRYSQPAGLPRAQEHSAHGALHRAFADPVQRVLARLISGGGLMLEMSIISRDVFRSSAHRLGAVCSSQSGSAHSFGCFKS